MYIFMYVWLVLSHHTIFLVQYVVRCSQPGELWFIDYWLIYKLMYIHIYEVKERRKED